MYGQGHSSFLELLAWWSGALLATNVGLFILALRRQTWITLGSGQLERSPTVSEDGLLRTISPLAFGLALLCVSSQCSLTAGLRVSIKITIVSNGLLLITSSQLAKVGMVLHEDVISGFLPGFLVDIRQPDCIQLKMSHDWGGRGTTVYNLAMMSRKYFSFPSWVMPLKNWNSLLEDSQWWMCIIMCTR